MEKQDYVIHTQGNNWWPLNRTRALRINLPPKRSKKVINTYSRGENRVKSLIG